MPIDPRDWYLLGCQGERGSDVFISTVGTFGAASVSYFQSRVAAAIGRITQYITSRSATTWHQLVSISRQVDLKVEQHSFPFSYFALQLECPGHGVNTAGDEVVTWVGFELQRKTYQLGTSEHRAESFIRWSRQVAASSSINISSFKKVLAE